MDMMKNIDAIGIRYIKPCSFARNSSCFRKMFTLLLLSLCTLFSTLYAAEDVQDKYSLPPQKEQNSAAAQINIKTFSSLVKDGNWSPAIQAAIDSVCVENGFKQGADILFPPGEYRIDDSLILGRKEGQHGTRLMGYGAVLIGSKTLDQRPVDEEYRQRKQKYENPEQLTAGEKRHATFLLTALPGELDLDGKKNVGSPILELRHPPASGIVGNFVIQGLTFTRERKFRGVAIKVLTEAIPKNLEFRDIKVYGQNIGIHINHSYQIRFDNCVIEYNRIGIWGRNHFNSVSIVNSTIRGNTLHGIVIGPNASQWGSTMTYIAGNIIESNQGYGIYNAGGNQVSVVGNYFEANANDVGIFTPYGATTLDTNFMWGSRRTHKKNVVRGQVVSNIARIVADCRSRVIARGNRYHCGDGVVILLFGEMRTGTSFDVIPSVAKGITLNNHHMIAASDKPGAYVYDASSGEYIFKAFAFQGLDLKAEKPVNAKDKGNASAKYVCDICFHSYDPKTEGPFEDLPENWVCPSCGAAKKSFMNE